MQYGCGSTHASTSTFLPPYLPMHMVYSANVRFPTVLRSCLSPSPGTLAAGINMPARTTIISSLARRTDDGIQLLPHNELLQMAGRAGRRGYDTRGNCVILPTRFEGADAGQRIIAAGPEPLISQFTTSYGMVLNLLSCYSLDEAKEFLSKSFGQYMSGAGNARRRKEVRWPSCEGWLGKGGACRW